MNVVDKALVNFDSPLSQPDHQHLQLNSRSSDSEVAEHLQNTDLERVSRSLVRDLALTSFQGRTWTSHPGSFININVPSTRGKSTSTPGGGFGNSTRCRFGSVSSPSSRYNSMQGTRHGRQGWRTYDNSLAEDDRLKLVSLSDLIRKEDRVPATLYEHGGDGGVVIDAWDAGGLSQQAVNGGTVGVQEAQKAAEHGNSALLSKFLQDGGEVATVSRLHHMRWSLLHLAAGCTMMGGHPSFANYRIRPEPDLNDGYASCVSELLAAGADPNVTSLHGGYTPLMGAALTGSTECCWLLLRAGAQVDKKADDGRTAFDFAQKARQVGGGVGGRDSVLDVLRAPPKKVPRSPTWARATLAELRCLEPEDGVQSVEIRWRVPSQASLLPTRVGDIERYNIKCWCRGKGKDVMSTTTTVDVPRRDFCRNQIIDRGIALRKNLSLPQSETASAIVHGLQAGDYYSFTISCVAEVDGALRHSPPSCMSKPLFIPESKEDHQWHLSGVLSMVTGNNMPSPGGPAADKTQQTRRAQELSVHDEDYGDGDDRRSGHKIPPPRGMSLGKLESKDSDIFGAGSAFQAGDPLLGKEMTTSSQTMSTRSRTTTPLR